MNRTFGLPVAAIVVIGIAAIVWYHHQPATPLVEPQQSAERGAEGAEPELPAPEYQIPQATDGSAMATLPALGDSDAQVRSELETLAGKDPVEALLIPNQIIRRWVAFIDSMDRDGLPLPQRPVRPLSGTARVTTEAGQLQLDPANAQRYSSYLALTRAIDAQQLVGFYFRYYPLFQRAYEELGNGGRYFNTRLLQVIDHLLATPMVEGPILLVRPNVRYQFADPDLEQRSFGQKTLLRLGPGAEAEIKAKLRQIRATIVEQAERPTDSP